MVSKLQELIDKTHSFSLEVNDHKGIYETVEQYLSSDWHKNLLEYTPKEVYDKMIELNTIIELQVYPENSVGFYKLYHWDLEQIINSALEL